MEKKHIGAISYSQVFNNMPSGIILINRELQIIDANPAAFKLYRYSKGELEHQKINILCRPATFEQHAEKISETLKTTTHYKFETSGLRKDGTTFDAELLISSKGFEQEGLLLLQIADISQRKKFERTVEQNEKRYRAMVMRAPLPFQSLDENGTITEVNPMWCKTLDYPREQVIGHRFHEFLTPESLEYFKKNFPQFKKVGEVRDRIFKMIKSDQSIIYVQLEGFVSYDDEGNFQRTYCSFKDITEQVEAKLALETREKQYRLLVENINDFIIKMDPEYRLLFITPQYCKKFEKKEDELLGKSFISFIHEDDKVQVIQSLQKLSSPPYISQHEEQTLTQDGWRWFSWSHRSILNEEGKIEEIISVGRDITRRKENKRRLEEQEHLISQAMSVGNLGSSDWNIDTGEKIWSDELYQIYGMSPTDSVPTPEVFITCTHPDDREKLSQHLLELKEGKNKTTFSYRIRRVDNQHIRMLRTFGEVKVDEAGNRHLISIVRDITEEHESESRYKSLFDDNSSVMLFINPETLDIINANQAAAKYYGYNRKVLREMSFRDINLSQPDVINQIIHKAPESNLDCIQTRHRLASGEIREVEIHSGQFIQGGEIVIYTIIHDISERRRAERDLVIAKEKAEESDKLKSAFLANMSHEIRTPMNGIIGFSEMLAEPKISDEQRKFYSKVVIDSSQRLLSLVNDILDISRIETGQVKVEEKPVNINRVLMDLYAFYSPRSVEQDLSFFPYLGLDDEHSTILTDSQRLQQILTNLLTNAFKFTAKGSIRFGYHKKDKMLEFFVKDTGIGIHESQHKNIFERFRQVEIDISKQYGGTGLGLSISKKLVELMGGNIDIESKPNKGTTVYFTLPYKVHKSKKSPPASLAPVIEPLKQDLVILIVEDEEINYLYLKEIMGKTNYKILHAWDGKEAVEMCEANDNIQMVLMDIKMPRMNGFEATQRIKKNRPNLPIIAQTAYAMTTDRQNAIAKGCDDYVAKPIATSKLFELINRHIPKSNHQHPL